MEKVNVRDALAGVSEHWSPEVLAELNGQEVRVAKLKGEFVWHRHEHEDELLLVISGNLRIEEGELLVVPRGVDHRPVAVNEAHVLLFEPASTVPTGD
jgi:mannose-6-phosphate isomerase-like protein (cupin superfamily)